MGMPSKSSTWTLSCTTFQGYETSLEAGARVLFNTPLVMNHQHNRGDLHAIHNHAPGKSLVGPIYLNKGRRTFYMQCGFHAYMESWAMAVNNPYYALTDENGKFSLEQVPPGTYQLVVWHPQTGAGLIKIVTVKADGKVTEHLSLPAPKGTVLPIRWWTIRASALNRLVARLRSIRSSNISIRRMLKSRQPAFLGGPVNDCEAIGGWAEQVAGS